jgi:DNA-binding response OmpR family regulator
VLRRRETEVSKVLLIEDDQNLSRVVCEVLVCNHFSVESVFTGNDGMDRLKFYQFDAVILDLDLPDIGGIEICRRFRASGGKTPILMLTGKDAIADKELGLDSGADDYLTKPFDMRELLARVRAAVRRGTQVIATVLQAGDLELDPTRFILKKKGETINMSRTDFALLEFLMRHPDRTFTAEQLLDRVWPSSSDSTVDSLRSSIRRIRKALDPPSGQSFIRNIYGVGYCFTPPADDCK